MLALKIAAATVILVALLPTLFRVGSVLLSTPLDPVVGTVERAEPAELRRRLTAKSCLVIGGTKGIGRAIAITLAGAGASVTVVGRTGGEGVVRSMEDIAPNNTQFAFHAADLSTVKGSMELAAKIRERGIAIDHLVFTVGVWPNFAEPRSADGIEKVIALDLLARFVIIDELKELLRPGARVMSVLASTVNLPFPALPVVRQIVSGEKKDGGLVQILSTAAAATDAMLHTLARQSPEVRFIGMHPGVLQTNLGASTFGSLNTIFGWLTTPIALSEEECGAVHVHALTADNAERAGREGKPSFFNHWLEGREATQLAKDREFGEWVSAWLVETKARLQ